MTYCWCCPDSSLPTHPPTHPPTPKAATKSHVIIGKVLLANFEMVKNVFNNRVAAYTLQKELDITLKAERESTKKAQAEKRAELIDTAEKACRKSLTGKQVDRKGVKETLFAFKKIRAQANVSVRTNPPTHPPTHP